MICGCARVSTDRQSVAAQVGALTPAGAGKVLREVANRPTTGRRQFRQGGDRLAAGDVLMVTRRVHLARPTRGLVISRVVIAVERELIRAHSSEGRDRAKACGVKLGRPFKLSAHQQRKAIRRRYSGEATLADIGRS